MSSVDSQAGGGFDKSEDRCEYEEQIQISEHEELWFGSPTIFGAKLFTPCSENNELGMSVGAVVSADCAEPEVDPLQASGDPMAVDFLEKSSTAYADSPQTPFNIDGADQSVFDLRSAPRSCSPCFTQNMSRVTVDCNSAAADSSAQSVVLGPTVPAKTVWARCIPCDVCGKSYACKSSMLRHKRRHDLDASKGLRCLDCNALFQSRASVAHHRSFECARRWPDSPSRLALFHCKECRAAFPTTARMLQHRWYECPKIRARTERLRLNTPPTLCPEAVSPGKSLVSSERGDALEEQSLPLKKQQRCRERTGDGSGFHSREKGVLSCAESDQDRGRSGAALSDLTQSQKKAPASPLDLSQGTWRPSTYDLVSPLSSQPSAAQLAFTQKTSRSAPLLEPLSMRIGRGIVGCLRRGLMRAEENWASQSRNECVSPSGGVGGGVGCFLGGHLRPGRSGLPASGFNDSVFECCLCSALIVRRFAVAVTLESISDSVEQESAPPADRDLYVICPKCLRHNNDQESPRPAVSQEGGVAAPAGYQPGADGLSGVTGAQSWPPVGWRGSGVGRRLPPVLSSPELAN